MTQPSRVFLYAEFQVSAPFCEEVWREANPAMQTVPGLRSKTWLSGINTQSIGGFYEFDSVQNARAYAAGMLADFAKAADASLTVKLFDGDVVAEASKGRLLSRPVVQRDHPPTGPRPLPPLVVNAGRVGNALVTGHRP